MIDSSLALLLLDVQTVTGATLLAITLAALILMDLTFDRHASTDDSKQ